ncbi:uracil-DNA glycosylase [Burkholderia sp. USMB20]|uniref:uracil-DNA glycosylase n=1 Tax=Burkholderia sp. USMB20 TaxID=1571773 RepID=UPI002E25BE63
MRRRMLLAILKAATRSEIDSIWIGRDLGYRGGRRTGLALTDDVYMQAHTQRWGVNALRPTYGQPVAERTAAVIWGLLSQIGDPIFLWNVFPLHPHEPSKPFSNRSHSAAERRGGEDVLAELIDLLKPRRLVAIGNDAAATARKLSRNSNVEQVRHPSYGGQSQFLETMRCLYGLAPVTGQLGMF